MPSSVKEMTQPNDERRQGCNSTGEWRQSNDRNGWWSASWWYDDSPLPSSSSCMNLASLMGVGFSSDGWCLGAGGWRNGKLKCRPLLFKVTSRKKSAKQKNVDGRQIDEEEEEYDQEKIWRQTARACQYTCKLATGWIYVVDRARLECKLTFFSCR